MDRSKNPIIDSPEKAAAEFAFIKDEMREHFVCMTLDAANRKIAVRVISIGTLTASLVHPREVFVDAILDRAASIVVGHNHPSGRLEASKADILTQKRLVSAGDLLGIKIIDHIIVTGKSYLSYLSAARGMSSTMPRKSSNRYGWHTPSSKPHNDLPAQNRTVEASRVEAPFKHINQDKRRTQE